MGRPSAWAVLGLMTSSNCIGCPTGRSAGLAPLRILVYVCGSAPPPVSDAYPIGHKPACVHLVSEWVHGRQPVLCRKVDDTVVVL